MGRSWAPLGRPLDAVGQLLGSLERFLGTSGLVWGASWADCNSRGSIFAGLGLPRKDFGASKGAPSYPWESPEPWATVIASVYAVARECHVAPVRLIAC